MNVAICAPSHGSAYRAHERCLSDLRRETGWPLLPLDDFPNIDIARSIIAETAIAMGVEVTLWVDADMTFGVGSCRQIVEEALSRRAIVGALYLGKSFSGAIQARFFPGTTEVQAFKGGGVIEVEGIGFGVTAVHTEVFTGTREKLGMKGLRLNPRDPRSYTPWFSTNLDGEFFQSDDYAFTERARRAGYKVFADTRQRVGHLGTHEFMLEDALPLKRATSLVLPITDPNKEPGA